MADRPATLVLSGGGAKGGFQAGAERVLREEFGFRWERIFGVSVGALNATLLAQREYARLADIWETVRAEDIYRKFPWPVVAFRVGVLRKLGFYDDAPLREFIQRHAGGRAFHVPAHVGRVSLVTGEYELVPHTAPDFLDAVWQSATMPVIWESIGPKAYVDGGLRNVTPLGDALGFKPTEIVVISCQAPTVASVKPPANLLDVVKRSLTDITINEIIRNDMSEFLRINQLVQQAEKAGLRLKKPDGTPYRFCPITVIEPVNSLGDTLDFSRDALRMRMRHGEEVARATLRIASEHRDGPPGSESGQPLPV